MTKTSSVSVKPLSGRKPKKKGAAAPLFTEQGSTAECRQVPKGKRDALSGAFQGCGRARRPGNDDVRVQRGAAADAGKRCLGARSAGCIGRIRDYRRALKRALAALQDSCSRRGIHGQEFGDRRRG